MLEDRDRIAASLLSRINAASRGRRPSPVIAGRYLTVKSDSAEKPSSAVMSTR